LGSAPWSASIPDSALNANARLISSCIATSRARAARAA
jgi:hypothetical protein